MNPEPKKNHGYVSPFSSRDCIDVILDDPDYVPPFSSRDCIDIIVDGPEDNTIRPLTGERLKRAMAERDKIAYWEAVRRGEITPDADPAKWKLP